MLRCLTQLLLCLLPATLAMADITVTGQATLKRDVMAPARTAGTLLKIKVAEGQRVRQGEVLGKIDDRVAANEFEAAQHETRVYQLQTENNVDLRLSAKSRAVSERELQRSQQANTRFADAVSDTELERLQLLVDQAKLSEEKAALDLRIAAANLELKRALANSVLEKRNRHDIVSPIDGVVVQMESQIGEWVDAGQPVFRIIKLDVLRVEADIDGTQFGEELIGQAVEFESQYRGNQQTHTGTVTFVSPEVNPVDQTIRIWADIQTPKRNLKPGMRGTLTITVD